ncbi:MAG TPA: polysaccharide deacetylase family protein [Symbiobacteriaceae bacterium]
MLQRRWTLFRVVRINRWSLALVLAGALALLLLPPSRLVPAAGTGEQRVAEGVTLLGRDFSGKTEAEAKAMLKGMRSALESPPINAREERDARGIRLVTPELNGLRLDVNATWARLAAAPRNTRVEPAFQVETPSRQLADYPLGVIHRGNPNKQAVTLMINVDWGTPELEQMLPILKQRGVKVTFFVSGTWAEKNRELLRRMAREGHEIATHGHRLTHGPKELAAAGRLKADIAQSVAVIQAITDQPVRYYAPHMSEVSQAIVETASALGLRTVLPSLDTVDWHSQTTPQLILSRLQKAGPGDLILLHPKPNTVQVLDTAIGQLEQRGLKPVTLSEMLSPDPEVPTAAAHPVLRTQ